MREPGIIIKELVVRCPACGSEALYRYGRSKTGKRRFLCLLCSRQFTIGATRKTRKNKPDCPACGRPMNTYMREEGFIRYRCSTYPECKTYKKTSEEA